MLSDSSRMPLAVGFAVALAVFTSEAAALFRPLDSQAASNVLCVAGAVAAASAAAHPWHLQHEAQLATTCWYGAALARRGKDHMTATSTAAREVRLVPPEAALGMGCEALGGMASQPTSGLSGAQLELKVYGDLQMVEDECVTYVVSVRVSFLRCLRT